MQGIFVFNISTLYKVRNCSALSFPIPLKLLQHKSPPFQLKMCLQLQDIPLFFFTPDHLSPLPTSAFSGITNRKNLRIPKSFPPSCPTPVSWRQPVQWGVTRYCNGFLVVSLETPAEWTPHLVILNAYFSIVAIYKLYCPWQITYIPMILYRGNLDGQWGVKLSYFRSIHDQLLDCQPPYFTPEG